MDMKLPQKEDINFEFVNL